MSSASRWSAKKCSASALTITPNWVEAYAPNHNIHMEWAEKGLRKEDYVQPALHRLEKRDAYGVYFIFKSMEQGRTFRISMPKFPTRDPNHRILASQRSRFTHFYFYIRDEVLGPMIGSVATVADGFGTVIP